MPEQYQSPRVHNATFNFIDLQVVISLAAFLERFSQITTVLRVVPAV